MEYVDVDQVILPKHRQYTKHEETHASLLSVPTENWEPIHLQGKRLVDGLQRVMCAIENNIVRIPARGIK